MGVGGSFSGVAPTLVQEERAQEVGNRMAELSAHVHAAMAEIVSLAVEFNDVGGGGNLGYRSFGHWLSVNCGFDTWVGQEMLRVGQALQGLPLIKAAFTEGRISFDKVRHVTRVATADSDELWVGLALDASGNQLARICRAVERSQKVDTKANSEEQQSRRGLRTQWLKNGMLHVVALLPPADGKLFLTAVEAATVKPEDSASPVPDGALERWAARRADGLILVLSRGLSTLQADSPVVAARNQVVVHVDFDLLTGMTDSGRCILDDGPAVALATLQRLGCTGSVIAMLERHGEVIDVCPERRFPTILQRRLIAARDKTCLVPGCGMPAVFCEPHHIKGWAYSHTTKIKDLGSLCLFHHQRVHEGVVVMIQVGPGKFRFETADGEPIPPVPIAVNPLTGGAAYLEQRSREAGLEIDSETPFALGGGGSYDLGLTVDIAISNPLIKQMRRGSAALPGP